MPQGLVELDFGAFPGSDEATIDVTGQTGFVNTSPVEAWIQPKATTDHTMDEHRLEELDVKAAYQADGTIRIYGRRDGPPVAGNADQLYGKYTVGWVWTN